MKKLCIAMGLAAAGTASLYADYAPGLTSMETTKFWSVSSSLRGFYDDNYTTSPDGQKKGSPGYELSPSVSINLPLTQTELGLKYTYGLYYYQDSRNRGNDPYDQSHQVDLWVDHAFTERWQATLRDTFVSANEPQLLAPAVGGVANPYRTSENNIANNSSITLTTDWTRLFSTVLSYDNSYYQYMQTGGTAANPSQNGLLTRLEQTIGLDTQWNVAPETVALLGYNFQFINYWGNEPIALNPNGTAEYSDERNSYSHIVYVGVQHSFLANLTASTRIGVQDTDNYNSSSPNLVTPYVLSSATYTYAPGSYVQLGVTHSQNATYLVAPNAQGQVTQNEQSTVISGTVNQQITAKLVGSIVANVQLSTFNQGQYNNDYQDFYNVGVNLTYSFNQHFSTELGYNFDDLQSQVPGSSYSRNRVYLGVTAAY